MRATKTRDQRMWGRIRKTLRSPNCTRKKCMESIGHGMEAIATPRKINMEPENHLFEKEKNLPNLHFCGPC